MLIKLRLESFKKIMPISIVGIVIGGLCLAMLVYNRRAGKSDVSDISIWACA